MYIEPGEMTNAEKLKFKYRVEKFEDEKLTVQLTFENPGHVSATKEQDILTVKLKELRDLDDKLIVEDWTIKRPLPNQLDEETAAIIDFVVQVVIATAGTGLSFVFTQKLILGQSLNMIIGTAKNMQVIVHLTLIQFLVPANSQVFMGIVFEFVTLDLIDTSSLTEAYFNPVEEGVEDDLAQLGYGSWYCLLNLGSLYYIIIAQILIVLLYTIGYHCFNFECW